MRTAVLLGLISGVLASATTAAAQGPIPPINVPDNLQAPVEGYSMAIPFQKWSMWVEHQRGMAIEASLAERPVLEGERQVGRPVLTFTYSGDLGVVAMGDIRVFCPQTGDISVEASSCHYLYRFSSPREHVTVFGPQDGEVARWTRENFNPALVVAALKQAGLSPDAHLWFQIDNPTLFAAHPSAVPLLRRYLQVVSVDSRNCPALHEAVEAIDRSRISWRADFMAVGQDERPRTPNPHAVTASYTLEILAGGGQVTLKGDGEGLRGVVAPALRAVAACGEVR